MTNRSYKFLIFIAILVILIFNRTDCILAQVRVSKITATEISAGKKGIVYALPRTVIQVDLYVLKTQQFPGPLAAFARDYLGLDEVITKSSLNYAVENAAVFSTTEPDPDAVYLIEKEEKSSGEIWISFGKTTPLLTLEKFDKTKVPDGFVSWNENLFEGVDPGYLFRKYTESPKREKIDTITRRVSIDTLVIEDQVFKRSMVEFTDKEKAQEAADKIKQIDKDKYNLMVGYQETAYSKDAMEFMFDKLEEERLEYLKLFTGVSIRETLKFTYRFSPDPAKELQEYRLAALSKYNGIIPPDGPNDVKVAIMPDAEILKTIAPVLGQPTTTGFVYRIPMSAQAVLYVQGKELDSKRLEILQFGSIQSLPQEFKRVEFDMETGTLKSVVLE